MYASQMFIIIAVLIIFGFKVIGFKNSTCYVLELFMECESQRN